MTIELVLLVLSAILNVGLAIALLFKSALNEIVVDLHKRYQERRARRRQLLFDLHVHMSLFDARYLVVTAKTLMDSAAADLAPEDASVVEEISARLGAVFPEPFQASLDFLVRHELEMPSTIRDLIVQLREAMRVADVEAITDPADVVRRTSAVRSTVEEIRWEVRRLLT